MSVRKIQYKLHEYQSAPKSGTDAIESGRHKIDDRDKPQ